MKDNFNELIIGSGGMNGLCYIGAIESLSKFYSLKKFKYLTGCSVGALLCFLLNINYSISEIKNIGLNINFQQFYELKISNLLSTGGFVDHSKIKKLLISICDVKNIDMNVTFIELYKLTDIKLTISGVNLSLSKCEYFNHETTPNMKIIDALIISMNIPILCMPYKYNNYCYIDGAVLDPFPYKYNKGTKKLNLMVYSEFEKNFIFKDEESNDIKKENNLFNIFYLVYHNYLKIFYNKKVKNTIYITKEPEYNFELDLNGKNELLKIGVNKANLFIKKKSKKIKKYYILKKYFNLLKYILI